MLPHLKNIQGASEIDFTRDDFDIENFMNNDIYKKAFKNLTGKEVSDVNDSIKEKIKKSLKDKLDVTIKRS